MRRLNIPILATYSCGETLVKVCVAFLLVLSSGIPTSAAKPEKVPNDHTTTNLKLSVGEGKATVVSVTLGQSATEVYNLCKAAKVYADDDPWFSCMAAGGGHYVLLFSAEGSAQQMQGRLDPSRDKLYAVVRYPGSARGNGEFLLPGSMRDRTYGDFVTMKVALAPKKAKVATVALGMSTEEVNRLFPSAPDRAIENHAVVFDSVYDDNKYLLIFTPEDDGKTHDPKLDRLSEVAYRLGDKAEAIYLLPRKKRGKPLPGKYRAILEDSRSDRGADQ